MLSLRGREWFFYNPHPQASVVQAVFLAVLSVVVGLVGLMTVPWIALFCVPGLGLSALFIFQWRWNARHPEVDTRVQRTVSESDAKHPVRRVTLTALVGGAVLPAVLWLDSLGGDGRPPSALLLISIGLAGAALFAGLTFLRVKRAIGVVERRRASASEGDSAREESAYRLAMSGLIVSLLGFFGGLPGVGGIAAIVMSHISRRRTEDSWTRRLTWAAEVIGCLSLLWFVVVMVIVFRRM